MQNMTVVCVALLICFVPLHDSASAQNAAADFSMNANPNGVWSYGYTTALGGSINLFSNKVYSLYGVSGFDIWNAPLCPDVPPLVGRYSGPLPNIYTIEITPGTLDMHPGCGGQYAVVRWTAPSTGTYRFNGKFISADYGTTGIDVHIILNSLVTSSIFAANVYYQQPANFDLMREVAAGESIDFVVGSNGPYYSDSTAFGVTVESITNSPPSITSIVAPVSPQPIGSAVTVTASFTDAGDARPHSCSILWDDGLAAQSGTMSEANGSGTCSAIRNFVNAGVYQLNVTIADSDAASTTCIFRYLVVYDPNVGFATGGGWIYSPEGAYTENPTIVGKATFGFVSKYLKGATVPTGQTEFQFQMGNLEFHSDIYEWLVIAGSKSQFKGIGTVNGIANYGFLLTATDGDVSGEIDKFRIKIWERTTGAVIYDNVILSPDDVDWANPQSLGGGNIVIHKK